MKAVIFFTILYMTSFLYARLIDVSDFGIVPGKDVTMEVNNLMESITEEENVTLFFPKGQYDFHPENAVEEYRSVANHDNGIKRMAFPIFAQKNLTIDGNGSVFMFHGRLIPFTLDMASQITLRNFVIDFIRPFHAELKIVERNEADGTVVLETDPIEYPYSYVDNNVFFERLGQKDAFIGSNIIFDSESRAPIYEAYRYKMKQHGVWMEDAGTGRIKLHNAFNKLPPVGSVLILYGNNPTSRLCHAIQITNSKNIRIEDVTIHAAGGMGLIVERTENVKLDGMKVTSTENRLVSTRADATHFIGCKGLIEVENCLFEHMLDDSINVHGAYVPIVANLQGRTFLCELSHFQQWGFTFAEPGDKVALLSRETILPFFESTVSHVRKLNERRFLITLENVPQELPDVPLSMENLTWNPDLMMRNNVVRGNRARSVLVSSKGKVIIEDNYFSSQMHGILIEGDNDFWYESGAVGDVLIRNNTFENIGFGIPQGYPLLASPKLTEKQRFGDGHYHRNIYFMNNTIRSFNGTVAKAISVENLKIEGNRIEFSRSYPALKPDKALSLEYCRNVEIKENTATGFAGPLLVEWTTDCETINVADNRGLVTTEASVSKN